MKFYTHIYSTVHSMLPKTLLWVYFMHNLSMIFCELVILWQHVTFSQHPWWGDSIALIGIEEIHNAICITRQLRSPTIQIMFLSTTTRHYGELCSPQIISEFDVFPPERICLSHKDMSWIYQRWHCCPWNEINWV